MLVLFTDTDCDITPDIAKYYGYELISMPYTVDEKEIYPYVDFEEFEVKEYYDSLRKGTLPTTSALSPLKYIEYFEPHFAAGNDILYVHFSKNMSGTFNAMNIAITELKELYPDRTIYTIDTKGITILSYLILEEIGEMYKNGKSLEEILKWADENVGTRISQNLTLNSPSSNGSVFSKTMKMYLWCSETPSHYGSSCWGGWWDTIVHRTLASSSPADHWRSQMQEQ